MQILKRGNVWVAEATYDERHTPKAAGWWWHGSGCRDGCKACAAGVGRRWWTPYKEKALILAKYALNPATKAELEAEARARAQARAASEAVDADVHVPAPPGLQYRPFQRAGIAAMRRIIDGGRGAFLTDEMGLGKSCQAIGLWNLDARIRRTLVICPASVKIFWKREFERWAARPVVEDGGGTHAVVVGVATGKEWPADADVVVINYDVLGNHSAKIREREWDLLVVDEAHYCKSREAQRTREVFGFTPPTRGRMAKIPAIAPIPALRKIALTGTPIVNRPQELYPLISALDPEQWPEGRFFGFAKRYCDAKQIGAGWDSLRNCRKMVWDFTGASHLDELHEKLRSTILIRRRKAEVLTELPAKIRQVIEIPANGSSKLVEEELSAFRAHQSQLQALRERVEAATTTQNQGEYANAVADLKNAVAVAFTEMAAVRVEIAKAKAPVVAAHLRDCLDAGFKVVFFAHHKVMIEEVLRHFPAVAVVITGQTPPAARQAIVDKFQNDPNVKLFVGSIRACGEGITLTAAAHVVFGELDWTPSRMSQAEDRCHRIGQTGSVLVQHLVLEGSLDSHVARTLVAKQDVIDAAVDSEIVEPVIPDVPPGPVRQPEPALDVAKLKSGRYAVDTEDGKTAFYRIREWKGWFFLALQHGGEYSALGKVAPDGACRGLGIRRIMEKIIADPRGAALRYGRELGICSCCGRALTDENSRKLGIGPVCAEKKGW